MKKLWFLILVPLLIFSILLVGCEEGDTGLPPPDSGNGEITETDSVPLAELGLSRDNPLPMGEWLLTPEGIKVTMVNLIEGNQAWGIIQEANMFNDPPGEGMHYVIVTVKVKNISSEDEPCLVSDIDFELIGSSNKVFHCYDRSVVLPDEGSLSELWIELYHGGEEIGSLHFYTPEDETNLVLIWASGFRSENKRFFEVR